jgi:hypothetical protein
MKRLFEKERVVAKRAREAVNALKPLRFTTDNLMVEIKSGGSRAEDVVALILHVEDLTVALHEVIGEVDAMLAQQVKMQQAQKPVPPSGGRLG